MQAMFREEDQIGLPQLLLRVCQGDRGLRKVRTNGGRGRQPAASVASRESANGVGTSERTEASAGEKATNFHEIPSAAREE